MMRVIFCRCPQGDHETGAVSHSPRPCVQFVESFSSLSEITQASRNGRASCVPSPLRWSRGGHALLAQRRPPWGMVLSSAMVLAPL